MYLKFLIVFITLAGAGCSTVNIEQYASNRPVFDLFEYFKGDTKGWGIVQDRRGRLTRQFVVYIKGTLDESGNLVLDENFVWSDGELQNRIWTINRVAGSSYQGYAADVIGAASGTSSGNALNWRYELEVPIDGTKRQIAFDDWMFLQPDQVLLNRAEMSKFGIHLGVVTIAFQKQSTEEGR